MKTKIDITLSGLGVMGDIRHKVSEIVADIIQKISDLNTHKFSCSTETLRAE